ncbi:hypothetical protein [Aeromicrobium massiliense]|uniref:hypothetical protein n=1 Tax=Aeromicrobium massiliense TaxID=1464554 RepID=UPI000310A58E|nr:hypothetical protein [Aeromicrobium massiliense]
MSEPIPEPGPESPQEGFRKALVVALVWIGVLLGVPLLITLVLEVLGVAREFTSLELTIVLLAQLVLALWLTRRLVRKP